MKREECLKQQKAIPEANQLGREEEQLRTMILQQPCLKSVKPSTQLHIPSPAHIVRHQFIQRSQLKKRISSTPLRPRNATSLLVLTYKLLLVAI